MKVLVFLGLLAFCNAGGKSRGGPLRQMFPKLEDISGKLNINETGKI
jgi:hypothetical protein